jgi:hypothetical protein
LVCKKVDEFISLNQMAEERGKGGEKKAGRRWKDGFRNCFP